MDRRIVVYDMGRFYRDASFVSAFDNCRSQTCLRTADLHDNAKKAHLDNKYLI